MVTGLRAEKSEVQIPMEEEERRLLQKIQTGSGTHPATYSNGTGGGG